MDQARITVHIGIVVHTFEKLFSEEIQARVFRNAEISFQLPRSFKNDKFITLLTLV